MDSKEGIEKTKPVNAWVGALLDPSHLRSGSDDTGASNVDTGTDPLWVGSPTGSSIPPDGTRKWESYCLFVRVLKDSNELLERDRLLPDHSWNAGICQDICEVRSGVPRAHFPSTYLAVPSSCCISCPRPAEECHMTNQRCLGTA